MVGVAQLVSLTKIILLGFYFFVIILKELFLKYNIIERFDANFLILVLFEIHVGDWLIKFSKALKQTLGPVE